MSRTKGAKNLPKDLERELKKLAQLYKDRGVDFPLFDGQPIQEPPAVDAGDQNKAKRREAGDTITFRTSGSDGDNKGTALECGNCHAELDRQYERCPVCGSGLTWQ